MAFVKIGDAKPITDISDGDEILICKKCNSPKLVVAIDKNNIKVICDCEIEETKLD